MDPVTVLTAFSTVLKIVDQVEKQMDRFIHKKPEPPKDESHKVVAEQETPGTLVVKRQGKVVDTITAQDIEKLDENSRKLIKALESSMQRNYDLWTKVYPERDISPDPVRNAQVEAQLDSIAKRMCSDLEKIFRFLDQIGKHLEDHYQHILFVCSEVRRS